MGTEIKVQKQMIERCIEGRGRGLGLGGRMDGVSICELHLMHACRKPPPLVAHGTQKYDVAARRANIVGDVGG